MKRKLFVIKIINTSKAEQSRWYKEKEGKLYICDLDNERGGYVTIEPHNQDGNYGRIPEEFSAVLTEFYNED